MNRWFVYMLIDCYLLTYNLLVYTVILSFEDIVMISHIFRLIWALKLTY